MKINILIGLVVIFIGGGSLVAGIMGANITSSSIRTYNYDNMIMYFILTIIGIIILIGGIIILTIGSILNDKKQLYQLYPRQQYQQQPHYWNCPNCNSQIVGGIDSCPNCGTKILLN